MGDQHANRAKKTKVAQQQPAAPPPAPRSLPHDHVHPLLHLQRAIGNQAVLRLLRSGRLQARRAISQPSDRYEEEADRMAAPVMRMPARGGGLPRGASNNAPINVVPRVMAASAEPALGVVPEQRLGNSNGIGDGDGRGTAGAGDNSVPKEVMDHLKLREGWRTAVYLDSRGLPTVGLGHLLTASEKKTYKVGDHVPEDILNAWAQADAKKAYNAGQSQAATLGLSDQSFINAMASVNFQLGTGWYSNHKKTWGYLMAHAWEKAALEAQDSLWYKQTPVRVQDFQAALRALAGTTTNAPSTTLTTPTAASGGAGPVKDDKGQGGKPGQTQWEEAPTLDAVRAGQAVLDQGHRGPAVSFVQEHMRIAHDGKFGHDTAKVVQDFQARNAKKPLPDGSLLRMDGKVDKKTLDLIERGAGGTAVPGTTALATTGGTDAAIEALDLAPKAKTGAYALKAKHLDIKFTSGRRNRAGQARAMASNVVHNRKWIQQTYASPNKMLLQNWVDSHPEATTVAALTAGLLEVLNGMSDEVLGTISKHPAGLAFDVQPVTKNAEEIKSDIRALPGIGKFLEKEAGLVRWHAPF